MKGRLKEAKELGQGHTAGELKSSFHQLCSELILPLLTSLASSEGTVTSGPNVLSTQSCLALEASILVLLV